MNDQWRVTSHDSEALVSGGTLTAASVDVSGAAHWTGVSETGLTLGIVRGALDFKMEHRPRGELRGGLAMALATARSVETFHRTYASESFDTLTLHLSGEALDQLAENWPILGRFASAGAGDPDFFSWLPGPDLIALVDHTAGCSLQGQFRSIYFQAKGLEMLSLMLARLDNRASSEERSFLRPVEVDRVHQARHIICMPRLAPPNRRRKVRGRSRTLLDIDTVPMWSRVARRNNRLRPFHFPALVAESCCLTSHIRLSSVRSIVGASCPSISRAKFSGEVPNMPDWAIQQLNIEKLTDKEN